LRRWSKLERYRGHFYNWYDTRTLEPLPPRYVSAVDSGNLAGLLLTLSPGLLELADREIVPPQSFAGLMDTAGCLPGRGSRPVVLSETPPSASPSPEIALRLERLQNELRAPPRTLAAARLLLESLASAARDSAGALDPVKTTS
jgi:cyclic beta-1,2-glucan synthetase